MKRLITGTAVIASSLAALAFQAPIAGAETTAGTVIPVTGYSQCQINNANVKIRTLIDSVVSASPQAFDADGDATDEDAPFYQVPTNQERTDLSDGINLLMAGNSSGAISELSAAGYEICKGSLDSTTSGGTDILIYDHQGGAISTTEGRPMLLLRTDSGTADDAAVFSGPHLTSERHIKDQILNAFQAEDYFVRAAVLAGTDRCNQLELGDARFQAPATTECGGDYRTSDMAHNVDTDFQVMHDRLRDHFPGSTNVQLHGMSLPGISVSRGDDPNDGSATFPNDLVAVAHQSYSQELTTAMRANGESAEETNQIANLTSCTPYFDTVAGRQALTRDDRCAGFNAQLWSEQNFGDARKWVHIEQSLHVRANHANIIGSDGFLESIYAHD
ncbi:hypothetical protein [Streptomyces sp. NPDC088748]|uniref:hypothetical protein n=1 Tax=Streptomyces sp. NPDC088748 TaxID=3365887 RepID=UPI0037F77D54